MKECVKCHKEKLLSEFVKDKAKKDGTRNVCKECYNLSKRKTPIIPKAKDGFKYCIKCNSEKPLEDFNVRMVNGNRKPFTYCKKCERDYDNNRYEHQCIVCNKVFKSGRKDSQKCLDCKNKEFGQSGKKRLVEYNKIKENNPWYGKHRFGKENPNYNPNKTDEEREKGRLVEGYGVWRDAVCKGWYFKCPPY